MSTELRKYPDDVRTLLTRMLAMPRVSLVLIVILGLNLLVLLHPVAI
jgi:hypothetical protein